MAAVRQNYKAKFAIALLPLKIQKIRKLILTDNAPQKEILEIVSKKVTKSKRFFPKNSLNSNNSVGLRRSQKIQKITKAKFAIALLPLKMEKIQRLIQTDNSQQNTLKQLQNQRLW